MESFPEGLDLWRANIGEGCDCVSVEGGERYLVEVDQSDFTNSGANKHGCDPGTNAAAADDDYEGVADLSKAFLAKESAVARELLEDQV